MTKISVVGEGDGEVPAARILLDRLSAAGLVPPIRVSKVLNAQGRGNLTTAGGVERFYRLARTDADAILFLADADADCPPTLAGSLAARIRAITPVVPVGFVLAKAEFESWFIADVARLAGTTVKGRVLLPVGTKPPADAEELANPKAWLIQRTSTGTTYKETSDQPALSAAIDLVHVAATSRSFRRLINALNALCSAVQSGSAEVSP